MKPLIRPLIILTSGVMMTCASGTLAADSTTRPGSPVPSRTESSFADFQQGARIGRLVQQLNLTDQQREQIRPIVSEMRQKLQTLRTELKDASVQERRTRIQEEIAPLREKLMSVLTDEQKAILKQKMEQFRQNHEKRFGKTRLQDPDKPRKRPAGRQNTDQ